MVEDGVNSSNIVRRAAYTKEEDSPLQLALVTYFFSQLFDFYFQGKKKKYPDRTDHLNATIIDNASFCPSWDSAIATQDHHN